MKIYQLKNKKIIFLALDCSIPKAKLIITSIPKIRNKKYIFGLKIGYQIFYSKQLANLLGAFLGALLLANCLLKVQILIEPT